MSNTVSAPKLVSSRSFAAVPDGPISEDQRRLLRAPIVAGGLTVLIFVVGFFVWAALFSVSGGVSAPAVVVVENNRKSVEHLDGGVIRRILIHEGDRVTKGEPLFIMDDTAAKAQVDVFASQYDNLLAQKARLEAELNNLPGIVYPPELLARRNDPEVATMMRDQQALFEAGRGVYLSQTGVLNQRVQELGSRADGLRAQVTAVDQENQLVGDELKGVQTLYDQGFAPKSRILALQRSQAELIGDRGSHQADIASTAQSVGEAQMQLAQVRDQRATQAADTLRQVEGQISDLEPRLRDAQDVLDRTIVRSPADGQVLGLTEFTEGGVAKPGERLLDVVPSNVPLEARAMVRPDLIDQVKVGMNAQVRISTSQSRYTPPLNAKVVTVAADRITNEKGESFFPVELSVTPAELKRLGGIRVTPGMSAQAMIVIGKRSILKYLFSPFTQMFQSSLHES